LTFPSSKADFDILKALGPDRQFTKLFFQIDTTNNPSKTVGVELHFKNGKVILLGSKGSDRTAFINKKVKHILVDKNDDRGAYGNTRAVIYYDE